MPLRGPIERERKQRPLYPTQMAPCTKHSTSALVAAHTARISSSDMARSRITRAKPQRSRNCACPGVRVCTWVEACSSTGRFMRRSDERIDPRADQLAGLALGLLQLVVAEQGVERGVDPHAVAAGVLHGPRDLRGIVGRGMARTEAGAADVHGVGAVVHSRDHRLAVAGRGQQFDGSLEGRHRGTDSASGQAQRFSG